MPPLTQTLLIANVAIFFLMQAGMMPAIESLALWPLDSGLFAPWQLITYGFLHASLGHLAFNMFGLWMFGAELERVWGPRRMALFYFTSVLVAALTQQIVTLAMGASGPTVGASGGLFGLLLGFAMVFPNRMIVPLIPPIPMRAPVFVALYGFVELAFGVTGTMNGVAHFAHLGGLLGGWLVIRYWRGQPPFGKSLS